MQRPLSVITQSSPLIFEGQVTGISSEVQGKYVYTWVEFQIIDILKGDYPDDTINLRYLGGQHGQLKLEVGEMRYPVYGESGIYFVESLDTHTVHPLRGWGQGHFMIKDKPGSSKRFVYTSQGEPISQVELETPDKKGQLNAHKAAGVLTRAALPINSSAEGMTATEFKQLIKSVTQP
jgi:hypothetical protein